MIYSNKSFPSFSFCSKFNSILKFVVLSVTVDLFSLQLGSQYQIHQVIIKLIAKKYSKCWFMLHYMVNKAQLTGSLHKPITCHYFIC